MMKNDFLDGNYVEAIKKGGSSESCLDLYIHPNEVAGEACMLCGWFGDRSELKLEETIETNHPKNRHNPNCNMYDTTGCHFTKFESCPQCNRAINSDNRRIHKWRPANERIYKNII